MISHFNNFCNNIKNNIPFSLIRPSDGEYYVLKKITFTNIDNWHHSDKSTLSSDLHNAIITANTLNNMYIGIPCKDCGEHGGIYNYYMNTFNLSKDKITYANIFGTYNFKSTIHFLKDNKIPFYYIGPGKKETSEFNIIERFIVNEFMVNNYDNEKEVFFNNIESWVENKSGIFLFSLGPISKIVIPRLTKKYPKNSFIDIGSPLDLFLKEKSSRPYMIDTHKEGQQICDFERGHSYMFNSSTI